MTKSRNFCFVFHICQKTKHMLEKQSGEKEIKALKDEIRALHVSFTLLNQSLSKHQISITVTLCFTLR